ncbi:hypothetical protein HN014_01045 [Aquimarina sp. TRL1]|uniref:hypothetical protein n=1 Tax=Aquimarina sp. (strain TRL1) TaxID=2736252 RepID=UPI00158CEA93|nr:hypothetical protein [Aquimarina sp. TRL1]QKX03556.1 hypothetical protein HN014_01045 [Aquimarina sp. TRL1]
MGSGSGSKWYKLMTLDFNGNGSYNSVNMTIDLQYVNTWSKYNANGVFRFRKGPNDTNADWQSTTAGTRQSVFMLKKIGTKVFEIWGYSNGGWGHLFFKSIVNKEGAFNVTIPDTPTVITNVSQHETIVNKGDWHFDSGNVFTQGSIGIGTTDPKFRVHIKDPVGGAAFGIERGGELWRMDIENTGDRLYMGHSKAPSVFVFDHRNGGSLNIGTRKYFGGYSLSVNGKIQATEVKVHTDWADYVFEKEYDLPTLDEVEKHIKEKGHLINIPSATEVARNGIYLGEINARLLEKIEELTLYTIAQEHRINEQKQKNKKLESRIERLEKMLLKN